MDFPQDISILYRKMHMGLNTTLDSLGLSSSKATFIFCIYEHEPMSQIDLCRYLDMDKSTVAKMLNRLIKDDLITKSVNPDDVRASLIGLTDKARALVPQAKQAQVDWVNMVTEKLTDGEKQILFELVYRVAKSANELCNP